MACLHSKIYYEWITVMTLDKFQCYKPRFLCQLFLKMASYTMARVGQYINAQRNNFM